MRTRGWGGDLPRTEDEARERIVAAAMRCIDRSGPDRATLADVAAELQVTRQTVYRVFPTTADLLTAVGEAGATQFLDRLTDHVADITDPRDALAEAIVYTLGRLPDEPYIGLLVQVGENELFSRGATSSRAMEFGASVLRRFPIDWTEAGIDDEKLEGLAEFMLRVLMSFLQYPSDPPRTPEQLRVYLRRWLGPALDIAGAADM
ncbi:TetR/AcrR family transcriptional regulator [Gordonia sp. 852002-10350_SCH5691597]|uniref:TetR/AcrR family transcriptional regulator n=1 Tax=Gordonia sp. 852002-10350_SCH5691597 TaxID=1834085 RepID=UPI0007EAD884|nr:TetR/AcrR family transcriptional regulator [Gordonia sp. 852002-10350_SCH5691597]OBA58624.1 TetR family transcriptional regulator [Gordonia sp. 852002-10350_SCH5691597]